jgi:hypothetical protein
VLVHTYVDCTRCCVSWEILRWEVMNLEYLDGGGSEKGPSALFLAQ